MVNATVYFGRTDHIVYCQDYQNMEECLTSLRRLAHAIAGDNVIITRNGGVKINFNQIGG